MGTPVQPAPPGRTDRRDVGETGHVRCSQPDDQVDSTAQFLDWFNKPFPGQGIFEYYRQLAQEAEERRKPQPIQTTWAIGWMEWQAAMSKSR
jgi:hypothetical protein